jgi:hypothetical protein
VKEYQLEIPLRWGATPKAFLHEDAPMASREEVTAK